MESFYISGIPHILFGEEQFIKIPKLLKSYGRNVLVIRGKHSLDLAPHWSHLLNSMYETGLSLETVSVDSEPTPEMVDEIVRSYTPRGIDVVLGIGGGSVLDTAKAAAGLLPHGNSVMDHLEGVGRGVPYKGPSLPVVAVPTTAGTGSEATTNSVLIRLGPDGFKKSFRHEALMPKVAVVDPLLSSGCPPDVTAACGMDALTQLIESYVSRRANSFTDAIALGGLEAAGMGLIPAWQSIPEGRACMAFAALCSGITLTYAGLGVVHGLAPELGTSHNMPHGVACGTLLAAATEVNIRKLREHAPESISLHKYAKIGTVLCHSERLSIESALDALIETLRDWTETMRIPRLSAYSVHESDLPTLAEKTDIKANPIDLTQAEIVEILKKRI